MFCPTTTRLRVPLVLPIVPFYRPSLRDIVKSWFSCTQKTLSENTKQTLPSARSQLSQIWKESKHFIAEAQPSVTHSRTSVHKERTRHSTLASSTPIGKASSIDYRPGAVITACWSPMKETGGSSLMASVGEQDQPMSQRPI